MRPNASRTSRSPRGPFSRPFDVRTLKGEPRRVEIEASAQECAAAAQVAGLAGMTSLAAKLRLAPRAGGTVELTGDVRAVVTQICVVSLEPFESAVSQPIALTFAPLRPLTLPAGGRFAAMDVDVPSVTVGGTDDQEDPPDPIIDDTIDLGAVALEFIVLGLDSHPRKPGVHFDDTLAGENEPPARSAFAALARLKDPP